MKTKNIAHGGGRQCKHYAQSSRIVNRYLPLPLTWRRSPCRLQQKCHGQMLKTQRKCTDLVWKFISIIPRSDISYPLGFQHSVTFPLGCKHFVFHSHKPSRNVTFSIWWHLVVLMLLMSIRVTIEENNHFYIHKICILPHFVIILNRLLKTTNNQN